MLKVLIYSYTVKIYSSRRIAKALREIIHFMWIAAGNHPDFRTINRYRLMPTRNIENGFKSTKPIDLEMLKKSARELSEPLKIEPRNKPA